MGQLLGNPVILPVSWMTHSIPLLHARPSLYKTTADAAPIHTCIAWSARDEDDVLLYTHPKARESEHALLQSQASAGHQQPVRQRGLLVSGFLCLCTSMLVVMGDGMLSSLHL